MVDPRLEKLARLIVEYSLEIKKGQLLSIAGSPEASPLIQEVVRAAVRKGANVETRISLEGLSEIVLKEASKEQLQYVSPINLLRVKTIDAYLGIWANANTRSMTNADPKKLALASVAGKKINKIFLERAAKKELRWCGTQWPNNAHAQDAEMSLEEYENFVLSAGHLDDADPIATWKKISASQKALVQRMNKSKEVRIVAKDTDITLSVRGRKWINCDGHEYFPDGEVFTGPVEKDVNGPFAVCDLGSIPNVDAIPQAADELMHLEGVSAVVVFGEKDGTLHLSGRSRDDRVHMGNALSAAVEGIPMSSAGGHARMGGGQVSAEHMSGLRPESGMTREEFGDRLFDAMTGELD